jgi:organic hydroperoxide reductase OsmC/OhrA
VGGDGHVRSSDGILDLDLRVPVELGGRGERATNPEQLFAAGYAACFEGTLREVGTNAQAAADRRPNHGAGHVEYH